MKKPLAKSYAWIIVVACALIIAISLFGCAASKITDAERGVTVSAEKQNSWSGYWAVCIQTSRGRYTIQYNPHCMFCTPNIPVLWDVAYLKNGRVIAKPVQ